MAARNCHGRVYEPGKPLSFAFRSEIIDMFNNGHSMRAIARSLKVTRKAIRKVIHHFQAYGTVIPFSSGGSEPYIMTDAVLQCVEIWKLQKPSIYASEIQDKLLREGICLRNNLPTISAINKSITRKLQMTHKKISQIPLEQREKMWKVDEYLDATSRLPATTLHFFDEASVVKTTSNRLYGSSYRGAPAIEIQKYASNATFTVNLLHSVFGVDYYNVLPGSSNGEELLAFFNDALDSERSNGLPVFLPGDTLVMDNCGFHHGRITERVLRQMCTNKGVTLLFQPPYSPHLNTCENCFHQMKQAMRKNESYAQQYTEMAIISALNNITSAQSQHYFKNCGYLL